MPRVGREERPAGELRTARLHGERDVDAVVHDEPRAGDVLCGRERFSQFMQPSRAKARCAKVQGSVRTQHSHYATGDVDEIGASDDFVTCDGVHHGHANDGGS